MSEITKLYKNCGIEPKYIDACIVEDKYWQDEELANEYGTFDMYMNAKCGHQEDCTTLCSCAYTKEEYPPFTAEKQLSLIKWLVCTGEEIRISGHRKGNLYWMSTDIDNKEQESTFEETLAKLVNNVWQYLTVEERKQIKEILE